MSYFGEFLVEKKAIKPEQLIEALIEQMNHQPLIAEVAWKTQMLKPEDMIKIFHYQQDHQVEFIQACRQLNLWRPELESIVLERISDIRLPLGQILIKKGWIQMKDVTKFLDEYLSSAQPVEASQTSVASTAIAEEDLFQHGILMELSDSFSDKKFASLKAAYALIKDQTAKEGKDQLKLLTDAEKILKSIREGIYLLGMEKMIQVIEVMMKHNAEAIQSGDYIRSAQKLYSMLEVAWDLRESIILNASEKTYFNIPQLVAKFDEIIK